jgi:hypothetical protein
MHYQRPRRQRPSDDLAGEIKRRGLARIPRVEVRSCVVTLVPVHQDGDPVERTYPRHVARLGCPPANHAEVREAPPGEALLGLHFRTPWRRWVVRLRNRLPRPALAAIVLPDCQPAASRTSRYRSVRSSSRPDPGVPEDSVQGSARELAMQWHNKKQQALWVLEPDVAAALTNLLPADPLERLDQLGAGDDRQALGHAGIASTRRTTPVSTLRPSSRSPST